MEFSDYYLEHHVRGLLAEARAAAARDAWAVRREARRGTPSPWAALRALYVRWSSAASTGSKPTTARACSISR